MQEPLKGFLVAATWSGRSPTQMRSPPGAGVSFGFQHRRNVHNEEADMELYAGIDLHSNNSMVVVLDETDRVEPPQALAQ